MKNTNFAAAVKKLQDNGESLIDIGRLLFPNNSWPYLALNRVLNGANIPTDAAKVLAQRCRVSIDFIISDEWTIKLDKDLTTFSNSEAIAKLNLETGHTDLYMHGMLMSTSLKHGENVKLSKYISDITNVFLNS